MKRDPRRFDDLFLFFGPVALRPMFGGEGLYAGDLIIGLVIGESLYLKTGDLNRPDFLAEGCKAFSFRRGRKITITSYYALPDRLLDDPEGFAVWAHKAHAAAVAAKARPRKSR